MFEKEGRARERVRERVREPVIIPKSVIPKKSIIPIIPKRPILSPVLPPVKKVKIVKPVASPRFPQTIYVKPYVPDYSWLKTPEISKTPVGEDGDVAKKLARIAAIKAANLSNKNYNVGGSTSPATGTPASGIIFGGGGSGGGYAYGAEAEGGSFLSNIPSIAWIILAVAGGWFLIKSSSKSGKLF